MFEPADVDALNENIAAWEHENKAEIIAEMNRLGIHHYKYSPNKSALQNALRSRTYKKDGLTSRIRYSMPRSAVFVHKGVSRKHPISNPRTAKPFFNPIVNKNLEKLAEIVSDGSGTMIVNALKIH